MGQRRVTEVFTARRRWDTFWSFALGTATERARRERAYEDMPWRVPELAEQLVDYVVEEPAHNGPGAIGVPLKVLTYILLLKVIFNETYSTLAARLRNDPAIWRLGWNKSKPPSKRTLCPLFGEEGLITGFLWSMIPVTASPGRKFPDFIIGDAHDIPTRVLENTRDNKYGNGLASYRKKRPLIRQNFAVGHITNLIAAVDISLNVDYGAGEGLHLPQLMGQAREVLDGGTPETSITKAAFDKGYGAARNYRHLETMGIDLYVSKKANEKRTGKDWCAMAKRMTAMEKNDWAGYHETSRYRNLAEGRPSSIKHYNPQARLRQRQSDKPAEYPKGIAKGQNLSLLPEPVIQAILDVATINVGVARLNEALAIIIASNLRRLVTLEKLTDDEVDFQENRALRPPKVVREEDLLAQLPSSELAKLVQPIPPPQAPPTP